MAWVNIHIGDYGYDGKLRITKGGAAQNISTYTTLQLIFRKPSGTTVAKTATFVTDGADGVLQYTVESGLVDEVGTWQVQARISKSGAVLTSAPIYFSVSARLD